MSKKGVRRKLADRTITAERDEKTGLYSVTVNGKKVASGLTKQEMLQEIARWDGVENDKD